MPAPWQVEQATAVSMVRSFCATEHGVAEVDVEPDQGVLAAGGARARAAAGRAGLAAEEGVHDVAEREALAEAGRRRSRRGRSRGRRPAACRVGQHVVGLARAS